MLWITQLLPHQILAQYLLKTNTHRPQHKTIHTFLLTHVILHVSVLSVSAPEVALKARGHKEKRERLHLIYTRCTQQHWVRKQKLWSADQPQRRAALWLGWMAADNRLHKAAALWKMALEMKGLALAEGCKWNVSWFIQDNQVLICSHSANVS